MNEGVEIGSPARLLVLVQMAPLPEVKPSRDVAFNPALIRTCHERFLSAKPLWVAAYLLFR